VRPLNIALVIIGVVTVGLGVLGVVAPSALLDFGRSFARRARSAFRRSGSTAEGRLRSLRAHAPPHRVGPSS
jgi:uncharacterized membrane protein YbaN (DUF454 family)